jgi:GNAT superfamily N-acetyltransferase
MPATTPTFTITVADPAASSSQKILRTYYDDIIGLYYGRPALPHEVDETMVDEPSDDLRAPTGVFLVATVNDQIVGCGGVRFVDLEAGVGEVTRIFVRGDARGQGIAAALLTELEQLALHAGVSTLRLTVRADLMGARRLYAHLGFAEVNAFSAEPYADHWLAKQLLPA